MGILGLHDDCIGELKSLLALLVMLLFLLFCGVADMVDSSNGENILDLLRGSLMKDCGAAVPLFGRECSGLLFSALDNLRIPGWMTAMETRCFFGCIDVGRTEAAKEILRALIGGLNVGETVGLVIDMFSLSSFMVLRIMLVRLGIEGSNVLVILPRGCLSLEGNKGGLFSARPFCSLGALFSC